MEEPWLKGKRERRRGAVAVVAVEVEDSFLCERKTTVLFRLLGMMGPKRVGGGDEVDNSEAAKRMQDSALGGIS